MVQLDLSAYDLLILPGTIAGTWYDCDVSDCKAFGNEYESYEACFEACVASGVDPEFIAPKGIGGLVAID